MIRYDKSPSAVLVWCSCGWRELCLTQSGAWRIAAHHEAGVHPDRTQIREAATRRVIRSAHVRDLGGASEDATE